MMDQQVLLSEHVALWRSCSIILLLQRRMFCPFMRVRLAAALVQLRLLAEIEYATEVDFTGSELEQCPQPFRAAGPANSSRPGILKRSGIHGTP
jgi:hypothetical protein